MASCKQKGDIVSVGPSSDSKSIAFQRKFFAAEAQKSIGNKDKAYSLFYEALAFDKENDAVLYELARIDFERRNNSQALQNINKAIEIDPENQWYYLLQGDIYFDNGDFNSAEESFRTITELDPDDMQAFFDLASVHQYQDEFKEAIEVYNQLEKKTGVNEELSLYKQQLYVLMGDYEKVEEEMLKLVDAFPNEIRYLGMLAQFYRDSNQQDKLASTLEKMTDLDPTSGMLHMQLSEYYAIQGDEEKSFQEMKIAFESNDIDIDQMIGVLLRFFTLTETDLSLLPKAYELLDIAVEVHGDEAKAHAMSGDFLLRDNELEKARESFREAIRLDPARNVIWGQILLIDSELGDFEALKDESASAMELFPMQPGFYLYNAIAHLQLGTTGDAIESLLVGRELVIEDPLLLSQFWSTLGDAYHQAGQDESSDSAYEEALLIDPNNVFVLNNYAYYLSVREDNLERAAEMSKRANELQPGSGSFQDTYGWVLYKQEKYPEARIWLEKAISSGAGSGEVIEHYGDVLFQLGEEEKALEQWKLAMEKGGGSSNLERKVADKTLYE
jgi:tetratricopeptide (TPR) repeat protein